MVGAAAAEHQGWWMSAPDPLFRLLAPLAPLPELQTGHLSGEPIWFRGDGWQIFARRSQISPKGMEFARFTVPSGESVGAYARPGRVALPFSPAEAYGNLVAEKWRAAVELRQLSTRQLSLFYRVKPLIPRTVQLAARRALIRRQGLPRFPVWPLDESLVRLLRFYGRCLLLAKDRQEVHFRWFWPGSSRAALILTHDVESAEGLRLALELADLEQERGLRSSFNVVASWYPIDKGILRELTRRGFELGVHGIYHDRSLFSSRSAFERQQPQVRAAAEQFGAEGFRSPSTHRVFEWLGELPVAYDCTIPHSDPFEPQPGGCCSVWPFFIGDLVELPYTMPQDHTLFTLLRHSSIEIWLRQLERLIALNGLVQSVTHPDPGYLGSPSNRRHYVQFLDAVVTRNDLWKALPRDIARWWRQRDAGVEGLWPIEVGTLRLEGDDAVLEPPG